MQQIECRAVSQTSRADGHGSLEKKCLEASTRTLGNMRARVKRNEL